MASGRPKTTTHSGSCLPLTCVVPKRACWVRCWWKPSSSRHSPSQVLHDAAAIYKVDSEAIALKVKQEFTAKEKTQTAKKTLRKPKPKP